jgi:hypothetical protein
MTLTILQHPQKFHRKIVIRKESKIITFDYQLNTKTKKLQR